MDCRPFGAFRSSGHLCITEMLVSEYWSCLRVCIDVGKWDDGLYEYNSVLIWNKGRLKCVYDMAIWRVRVYSLEERADFRTKEG